MSEDSTVRQLRLAVRVEDFDATVRFYRDVLGLAQIEAFGDNGRGVVLEAGRATLELLDTEHAAYVDQIETGEPGTAPRIRVALEVTDPESTAERLTDAGAHRLGGPVITPWNDQNVRVDAPYLQLTLFGPVPSAPQAGSGDQESGVP